MSEINKLNTHEGQVKRSRKPDDRARRTRQRLSIAMLDLLENKPVREVKLKEILDRASVGRSTFYLHYRDKDDLILGLLEWFLQDMSTALTDRNEQSERVLPVAEIFSHLGNQNSVYLRLVESGHVRVFFDLAQGYFARGIERRLLESRRLGNVSKRDLAARASALAGSLLALLRWWLEHGEKESPRAMDDTFHRMVWHGIE